jgi:hypothetical protein
MSTDASEKDERESLLRVHDREEDRTDPSWIRETTGHAWNGANISLSSIDPPAIFCYDHVYDQFASTVQIRSMYVLHEATLFPFILSLAPIEHRSPSLANIRATRSVIHFFSSGHPHLMTTSRLTSMVSLVYPMSQAVSITTSELHAHDDIGTTLWLIRLTRTSHFVCQTGSSPLYIHTYVYMWNQSAGSFRNIQPFHFPSQAAEATALHTASRN